MSTNLDHSQNEHDAPSGSGSDVGLDQQSSAEPSAEPLDTEETTHGSTPGDKSPLLPQISPDNDFSLDLHSIISAGHPEMDKVNKRASNVQKLAQENEKLKEELRAMSQRLEAAERRRQELVRKKQGMKEPPSE
ncbi:hypothetical protein J3R30DRAFT_3433400 [Lentinula aciculospora]|uniref:Uncharacterized protein n=1 Tax=Lentinula aciculospora TaxID=153920 RepID=A0A9W9AQ92_9AGAR|nr:hypothetical protein J3R30DRAFT_3433400 [Lentinula aciculospora]